MKEKSQGLSNDTNKTEISHDIDLEKKSFANAVVLSTFPLLYFFTFLYYTDQGSTFMVLLMYWFSLQENHLTAALTGTVAVIFRQTNIIWVAFVAGNSLLRIIQHDLPSISIGLPVFLTAAMQASLSKLRTIVSTALPYLCVAVAFVYFVLKNNGIVVGDRSSHQACFNIPQLFYFIAFSMAFSFPQFISLAAIKTFRNIMMDAMKIKKWLLMTFLCIGLMTVIVLRLTYVHEYLLADNRHYTFYIWRRIFQRHWTVKYLAIPVYSYGALAIQRLFIKQNSGVWICLYAVAVCLVTVPQKLLEFRYFIIPYLMFRLHTPIPPYLHLALEMALYLVVNTVTIGLFLCKPFYWENDKAMQRFMW